jgi:1-deoxy-D-xylulose-5-phosphate reductoisomerase
VEDGRKVTVDSATLLNKGLEVIEAHRLFDIPYEKHKSSDPPAEYHSLDGGVSRRSTKAQIGYPDMRLPIQYALTIPNASIIRIYPAWTGLK